MPNSEAILPFDSAPVSPRVSETTLTTENTIPCQLVHLTIPSSPFWKEIFDLKKQPVHERKED